MPTFPYDNEFSAFTQPGGHIELSAMFETYVGSGVPLAVTGPLVTITPVDSGTPVIGPVSPSADGETFTYDWYPPPLTPPGDYEVTWTGTGPGGALTITMTVTVETPPSATPGPGTYATYAQYQAWSMDQLTPQVRVIPVLRRATEVIDRTLIGAVYQTDADGMPTQAHVIDALMRATCAQAQFMLANNDPANIKSQFASTSMGGVSQTRALRAQGQVFPPLAPQAAAILQEVGVLATAPLSGW